MIVVHSTDQEAILNRHGETIRSRAALSAIHGRTRRLEWVFLAAPAVSQLTTQYGVPIECPAHEPDFFIQFFHSELKWLFLVNSLFSIHSHHCMCAVSFQSHVSSSWQNIGLDLYETHLGGLHSQLPHQPLVIPRLPSICIPNSADTQDSFAICQQADSIRTSSHPIDQFASINQPCRSSQKSRASCISSANI